MPRGLTKVGGGGGVSSAERALGGLTRAEETLQRTLGIDKVERSMILDSGLAELKGQLPVSGDLAPPETTPTPTSKVWTRPGTTRP